MSNVNEPQVPNQTVNNRSILLLREINSDTPEQLVKDIFVKTSQPVRAEYAHNNSWYVTFKNDEEARLALAYIRNYEIEWNNKPIMARIKSKPAPLIQNPQTPSIPGTPQPQTSPAPSGSHYSHQPSNYYGQPAIVNLYNEGDSLYLDLTEYFKSNGLVPDQTSLPRNNK